MSISSGEGSFFPRRPVKPSDVARVHKMSRMPYAEVAVDAPVREPRTFTYAAPEESAVVPGQMVQVPFGPRMVDGVVFRLSPVTSVAPVKPITQVDASAPVLSPAQLSVALWLSDYYLASLYSAAALMLPPGSRNRTAAFVMRPSQEVLSGLDEPLRKYLSEHFRGRRRWVAEGALRRSVGRQHQRALDSLLRRGVLTRSWRWRRIHVPKQWPGRSNTADSTEGEPALAPTPFQRAALQEINSSLDSPSYGAYLLQGVTGSGKTEVYLQALARCIDEGRKAIVLVPEISLTPQTVRRFEARFPGRVGVIHSRLSTSEHRRTWWDAYHGRYQVIVGSRSALFAPLSPLGLIVIDEEHEWTYKQQEVEPRYHTRTVATQIAREQGATLVLGSATPDVASYHRAVHGDRLKLLTLPHRVGARGQASLAPVQLVDMRKELREGHRGIFSRPLSAALKETVARGDQAILFINRRGDSGVVHCRDCGYVLYCDSCDVALTYHSVTQRLVCHQCNRRRRPLTACPSCRSPRFARLGIGTQRVVDELEDVAPGTQVLRWDRDAVATQGTSGEVLEAFARGDAQVLVGTQMVAKSLHVPSVTLVGAVLADIGLHVPDFRSGERIFQLICQVAGRAGRGVEAGRTIVQTYRPEHYAVALAAEQDYEAFYRQEIDFRRIHRFPPFSRLINISYEHRNAGLAEREAMRVGRALRHQRQSWGLAETELLGPAPAYPTRARGKYRWHVVLRGSDPRLLLDKTNHAGGWTIDVDPISVV